MGLLEPEQDALRIAGPRPATAPRPYVESDPLSDLDTQLMLRVRDGDQESANVLVRRNFDRVARYIGRIVRDARWIEDLTQDVFMQVLKTAARYEPTAKFSTWLYCVATNTALKHLRSAEVRQLTSDSNKTGEDVVDLRAVAPDRRLNVGELRQRVSDAISELPEKQRIALTLCEFESLSYEQIARVLEVTVEAVRSLLNRARTTLREKLANVG